MPAPRLVTLYDGVAEATVAPDLGGGLASYDLVDAVGRAALFRPCRDLSRAGPFDLANNLLVPWSNRISDGGFHFGGRFHQLEPNLPSEPYPIHGNGFSSAWSVKNASAEKVELSMRSNGPGPFCYEACATYALDAGTLSMWLWVRNVGTETLPFGLGFHPWLVRTPGTLLQAKAKRVVLENSDHLPDGEVPVASRVGWDFGTPRALPGNWTNNAFEGWVGRVTITGPIATSPWKWRPGSALDLHRRLALRSGRLLLFEPVMHPVDAHKRPGGPAASGQTMLALQENVAAELSLAMAISTHLAMLTSRARCQTCRCRRLSVGPSFRPFAGPER